MAIWTPYSASCPNVASAVERTPQFAIWIGSPGAMVTTPSGSVGGVTSAGAWVGPSVAAPGVAVAPPPVLQAAATSIAPSASPPSFLSFMCAGLLLAPYTSLDETWPANPLRAATPPSCFSSGAAEGACPKRPAAHGRRCDAV